MRNDAWYANMGSDQYDTYLENENRRRKKREKELMKELENMKKELENMKKELEGRDKIRE